jgi:hypothetical protein
MIQYSATPASAALLYHVYTPRAQYMQIEHLTAACWGQVWPARRSRSEVKHGAVPAADTCGRAEQCALECLSI